MEVVCCIWCDQLMRSDAGKGMDLLYRVAQKS